MWLLNLFKLFFLSRMEWYIFIVLSNYIKILFLYKWLLHISIPCPNSKIMVMKIYIASPCCSRGINRQQTALSCWSGNSPERRSWDQWIQCPVMIMPKGFRIDQKHCHDKARVNTEIHVDGQIYFLRPIMTDIYVRWEKYEKLMASFLWFVKSQSCYVLNTVLQ